MKLFPAMLLACLPWWAAAAKAKDRALSSGGTSSLDEWAALGKKQLGQGKAKESAASYRTALKVFYAQPRLTSFLVRSAGYFREATSNFEALPCCSLVTFCAYFVLLACNLPVACQAGCASARASAAAHAGLCQALLAQEDWASAQVACARSASMRNAVADCLSVLDQAQVNTVRCERCALRCKRARCDELTILLFSISSSGGGS
jgi:hypothetical protein